MSEVRFDDESALEFLEWAWIMWMRVLLQHKTRMQSALGCIMIVH